MDKASVLGDAATYIKELQERVKTLEEKANDQKDSSEEENIINISSAKRSRIHADHEEESSSCDGNSITDCSRPNVAEIQVRISERNVLFRVLQVRNKISGFVVKLLSQIEKLHMTIITTSVMPFPNNTSLHITIIAQVPTYVLSIYFVYI